MAIYKITDTSGSVNNKITRGGNLIIAGENIRVGVDHKDIGVYFVSTTDEKGIVRVREGGIFENNPNEVVVEVPFGLNPDCKWYVEIRTQYSEDSDKILDAPRATRFTERLRVRNRCNCERLFGEDAHE